MPYILYLTIILLIYVLCVVCNIDTKNKNIFPYNTSNVIKGCYRK